MEEYKLQQVGMVDERQVVELGRWLAANEVVTGKLALFGDAYVLQVKRTDIKTLEDIALDRFAPHWAKRIPAAAYAGLG
jgi:hypothetical protein